MLPITYGLLLRVVLLTILMGVTTARASTARLTADAQPVLGWGCFQLRGLEDQPASTQQMFYDLGMTYVRLELRPECGNAEGMVDAASMDHLVGQIKLAKRHGITKYILSIWSPPDGMKLPDKTHLGKSAAGGPEYLNPDYEDRYMKYLTAAVNYLKAAGCNGPTAISIQNEPDAEPEPWDGCRYVDSPAAVNLWRRVLVKLRATLNSHGDQNVEIIGPETSKCANATALLSPVETLPLGGIAYHSYDVSQTGPLAGIIASLHKPVWMTEWSDVGQHDDLVATVDTVRRMNSDLVDMKTNYWTWWYGWRQWNDFDGEELLITRDDGTLRSTRLYSMFKRLWSTVRPGWHVTPIASVDPDLRGSGAGSGWPQVEMIAFRDPGHRTAVILVANPTKSPRTFTFTGLPSRARTASIYEWSEADVVPVRSVAVTNGEIADVQLPAYGVQMYVTSTGGRR